MIKTPPGWGADLLTRAFSSATWFNLPDDIRLTERQSPIVVARLGIADLRWALARGMEDFGASRSDVIFLCVLYPLLGLLLARMAFGYEMLPLVFPLASGFALLGPLAAIGLNEMSRRREMGRDTGWADAFGVLGSPSIVGIVLLGAALVVMFLLWLVLAQGIYNMTLGPQPPASLSGFVHDLFYTSAGRTMVILGFGVGFVFAAIALSITVVSFPMLLDRTISVESAVMTSVKVVQRNPLTIAVWGLIVAGGLVLGSIPLLLGLVFVLPVLGHATWHLYRRAVPR